MRRITRDPIGEAADPPQKPVSRQRDLIQQGIGSRHAITA
jgi:hypothetical protein